MDDSEIEAKLIELISTKLGKPKDQISAKSYFSTDLGLSSFDAMNMVCDVEEAFQCDIPDEAIKTIKTVGDLTNYIKQHKK